MIEWVQVEEFKDGWAYRLSTSIGFTLFTCSFGQLAKQLIDEHNNKIMEWVNEAKTDEEKGHREKKYAVHKWEKIQFYSEAPIAGIII